MRNIHQLLLAAGSVLALAGCGSSATTSSSADSSARAGSSSVTAAVTTPASSASFAATASGICAKVDRDVTALPAITTRADLLSTGAKELMITTAAIDHLKTLAPPADQRVLFHSFTAGLTHEGAMIERVLTAIRAGDTKQADQIANQNKALNLADNAKAKRLGLPACAANATPRGRSTSNSG